MPPRIRLFYSALTLALLFIPAVALYSELSRRPDIWCVARLPLLLVYAATLGGGMVILLVVATGRLAYRGERPVAA